MDSPAVRGDHERQRWAVGVEPRRQHDVGDAPVPVVADVVDPGDAHLVGRRVVVARPRLGAIAGEGAERDPCGEGDGEEDRKAWPQGHQRRMALRPRPLKRPQRALTTTRRDEERRMRTTTSPPATAWTL